MAKITQHQSTLAEAKTTYNRAQEQRTFWSNAVVTAALFILAGLIVD